jgi:hypothetical protein
LGGALADRIRGRPTDAYKSFILIICAQANFFSRFHRQKVQRLSKKSALLVMHISLLKIYQSNSRLMF